MPLAVGIGVRRRQRPQGRHADPTEGNSGINTNIAQPWAARERISRQVTSAMADDRRHALA